MKTRAWCAVMLVALGVAVQPASAYSVSYDQEMSSANVAMTSTVLIEDEQMRMESTMGSETFIILKNHEGIFNYMPGRGMAMKVSDLSATDLPLQDVQNYQRFLQERGATLLRTETVEGRMCDVYQFLDEASQTTTTAWVWQERHFPIKLEIAGPTGPMRVVLKNIKFDVPVPDAAFVLPEGVRVFDMGSLLQGQPSIPE